MSRFAALTGCAVAVLAGFGMQAVLERTGWRERRRVLVTAVVLWLRERQKKKDG